MSEIQATQTSCEHANGFPFTYWNENSSDHHVPAYIKRIQCSATNQYPGADPGIYFGGGPNQGPQSKVEGEARIEGAKRPSIEGEARVQGAKRPRIEGEARTEVEAREKAGGGVWGGGSVSPSPENFWKIKLETIHFGAYLRQLFEMTNKMV